MESMSNAPFEWDEIVELIHLPIEGQYTKLGDKYKILSIRQDDECMSGFVVNAAKIENGIRTAEMFGYDSGYFKKIV